MKALVLLSGGLDSAVLAASLQAQGHDVLGLGVHYGQAHARELVHAQRVADALGVPFTYASLPGLGGLLPSSLTGGATSKVVPNRNTILTSLAVGYASAQGCEAVALGVNASDARDFYDCRPPYVALLRGMAEANGVELWAPFLGSRKAQVAELGQRLGVPMHLTRSCYRNAPQPCGDCDACADRDLALQALALHR